MTIEIQPVPEKTRLEVVIGMEIGMQSDVLGLFSQS